MTSGDTFRMVARTDNSKLSIMIRNLQLCAYYMYKRIKVSIYHRFVNLKPVNNSAH